ncbi:hypothetical protein [Amycolatopsis sp. NPDC052450]|uniref:hypothetical protein n=1 Tax=Amycolatopsis sp. NPDC052450 TaxID=3363937 RepID=UPI0037CB0085
MILERFPRPAVNCYTGSLVRLASLHDEVFGEAEVLERGDGYLLRSGHDERGYPEYTFAVEEVGMRGLRALGHDVRTEAIDEGNWREQLRSLLRAHKGVVAWTNSEHLAYAEVYATNPGYLHAVLVQEVSADLQRVRVHDSLVVDTERFACDAWLSAEAFGEAIIDSVATETYDHMGFFHTISATAPARDRATARADLARQARRFGDEVAYHDAVAEYRRFCAGFFAHGDERATRAARRLFDHINVLYVLPNLNLLNRSLVRAEMGARAVDLCGELVGHWKVLALQALKFEATLSPSVRKRIDDRFHRIDDTTTALWQEIRTTLDKEQPDERARART